MYFLIGRAIDWLIDWLFSWLTLRLIVQMLPCLILRKLPCLAQLSLHLNVLLVFLFVLFVSGMRSMCFVLLRWFVLYDVFLLILQVSPRLPRCTSTRPWRRIRKWWRRCRSRPTTASPTTTRSRCSRWALLASPSWRTIWVRSCCWPASRCRPSRCYSRRPTSTIRTRGCGCAWPNAASLSTRM